MFEKQVTAYDRYSGRSTTHTLTLSERIYRNRAWAWWWFGVLSVIVTAITLTLFSEGYDGGGDLDAESILAIIIAGTGGFCSLVGAGVASEERKNPVNGIEDSRGIRRGKGEAITIEPRGDEVIVRHAVRTAPTSVLWPMLGPAPQANVQVQTFDATTDEGQEAAHDFVRTLKEKPVLKPSAEAKALAKALK